MCVVLPNGAVRMLSGLSYYTTKVTVGIISIEIEDPGETHKCIYLFLYILFLCYRFKWLEIVFYLTIGIAPSYIILEMVGFCPNYSITASVHSLP